MLESRASEFAVERAELRATLDTLQAEKVMLLKCTYSKCHEKLLTFSLSGLQLLVRVI